MKVVTVEERHAADPFLFERAKKARRPGVREFVAVVGLVEAGLLIFQSLPNALGLVYEIYVLPDFRRQGVGNLLLAHAETAALDSACNALRLMARSLDQDTINDEALTRWYARKGFLPDSGDPGWLQKDIPSASMIGR